MSYIEEDSDTSEAEEPIEDVDLNRKKNVKVNYPSDGKQPRSAFPAKVLPSPISNSAVALKNINPSHSDGCVNMQYTGTPVELKERPNVGTVIGGHVVKSKSRFTKADFNTVAKYCGVYWGKSMHQLTEEETIILEKRLVYASIKVQHTATIANIFNMSQSKLTRLLCKTCNVIAHLLDKEGETWLTNKIELDEKDLLFIRAHAEASP